MKKALLDDLKKSLETRLDEITEELETAKANSRPVELDQQAVGRVSRIDAIQQQQIHLNSLKNLESQRQLIEAALSRVKTDDYGYCLQCEELIEEKRLIARPESPICLKCARR